MSRPGGPVPTHAERQAAGAVRLDVYLPLPAAEALARLCAREADRSGLPATRCRTQAVIRAIEAEDRRNAKRPPAE